MPKLKRTIGLFESTAYGVGIILGAGIYALIGEAAGIAGNALWMSFIFAAIIASLTGLSYAELSSRFPKCAAEFVYTQKAFKNKLLSFLIGFLTVYGGTVAASTVSLGFAGYFSSIFNTPIVPTAVALIVALSFLNFFGIKESSRFNILATLLEASGLFIIIFLGLGHFGSVNYLEMPPSGFGGVLSAAIIIFFAYLGFEALVNMAEETKKPRITVPKSIVLSVLITTIIYVLVSLSVVSLVPANVLAKEKAPLAVVAEASLPGSAFLLQIIALFATSNTVLVMLIVGSRILYGMSKQGVLQECIASIHPERKTPHIAILIFMIFSILFTSIGEIKTVAEMTNFAAFLVFFTINASLIYVRLKGKKAPFQIPFNIGKVPVTAVLGAVLCLAFLTIFNIYIILFSVGVILVGVVLFYAFNGRK